VPINIGGPEIVILVVIVLIVFGAGRLPEAFSQVGRGVRAFRDELSGEGAAKAESTDSSEGRTTA
jgi:sec-independent protein translocase protein TatA